MSDFLLNAPERASFDHQSTPYKFRPPPLDGSRSIPEILEWHSTNNPSHPLFVYSNPAGIQHVTFGAFSPAMHRAGLYVAKVCGLRGHSAISPIIAILATSDTITTFTTMMGIVRAGMIVFPLSPRFSPNVLGHLLASNNVEHLLISTEPRIQKLAEDALVEARLIKPAVSQQSHQMPTFEELYHSGTAFQSLPPRVADISSTSFIVHSSASTSKYPKAVRWTLRHNLQNSMASLFSADPLCNQVLGCHGLEPFHTLGLILFFCAPTCGYTFGVFEPKTPAIVPTPDAVFQGYRETNPTYAIANPRFIQEWSTYPTKVSYLSSLKGVVFGGKLLSRPIGNELTAAGVRLRPMYGSTEAGQVSVIFSAHSATAGWEYFQINPHCSHEFVPVGDGSYKLFVTSSNTHDLSWVNCTHSGRDAYCVGDLLMPHAAKIGLWKVIGREDDQIIRATGEIIHPADFENRLCLHPQISSAVVFGSGRLACGVLLELEPVFHFEDTNPLSLNAFRNEIWKYIEPINTCGISKDKILIGSASKPFTFTPKGCPKRAVIVAAYQLEIDALYGSPANDPLYTRAMNVDRQETCSHAQLTSPLPTEPISKASPSCTLCGDSALPKSAQDQSLCSHLSTGVVPISEGSYMQMVSDVMQFLWRMGREYYRNIA